MNYDFDNFRYFGHVTSNDPDSILEEGININEDVYGKRNLLSTTYEIHEDDLVNGEEYLVNNVFSVGSNKYRKYLFIVGYQIGEINPHEEADVIYPENIVGYYDSNCNFINNEIYDYNDLMQR